MKYHSNKELNKAVAEAVTRGWNFVETKGSKRLTRPGCRDIVVPRQMRELHSLSNWVSRVKKIERDCLEAAGEVA